MYSHVKDSEQGLAYTNLHAAAHSPDIPCFSTSYRL